MKKILIFLFFIFCLIGCVNNEDINQQEEIEKYTITLQNCGYGGVVQNLENKTTIPCNLPILFEDGYKFLGWYLDSEYEDKVLGNETLTADITIYAKWEKLEYSDGFEYVLSSTEDSYILVYYNDTGEKDVIIPPTHNDLPVKYIGEGAIIYNNTIESVMIPSTVEKLEAYAFSNCHNLKYVSIGKGLKEINYYSFCNVPSLETIIIDQNNPYLDSRNNCNAIIDSEENSLIKGCKTTIIPNDVVEICLYAFYGCSKLTEITIPDSVTIIGQTAFHSCTNLNTIVVGRNLNDIGDFAFVNCTSLRKIFNNSSLIFEIGSKEHGSIAVSASEVYNKNEWSYVSGVPTPNK